MIKSMTGYSKIIENYEDCSIKIEIKSLNSKFLDAKIKLPKLFNHLEIKILSMLREKLVRGKVDVYVDITYNKTPKIPKINNLMVNEIVTILNDLKNRHGINDDIKIEHLLKFDDVLFFEENEELEETISNYILKTFMLSISKLDQMRIFEGDMLKNDLLEKLDKLKQLVKSIDLKKDAVLIENYEKIKTKIQSLMTNTIDHERLYQEAAINAEKMDIEEEVTRLKSHITHFLNIIEHEFPVGKKLDFMCQELFRELNTIGSKTGNTEVIEAVVEGKNIVDKLREQVQNIV
ncbi:MAG: YicC family protein [Calditerrivibrio sp.]|nr:YicC family protein [Calditerrivibrio sp.]